VKLRIAGLLLLMTALFVSTASAQPMISYGVTAGWGLASISAEDDELNDALSDMRNGLDIGGFVEVPVNDMFSVVIAGKYAQKGAKGTFTEDGISFDSTVKVDYIDIPILANFPINTMGSFRPFIYAGGVPAFKVSAKSVAEFEGEEFEEDLDDEVKSFDFGLMFGGGVQFGGRYGVAVDYNLGLLNVNEEEDEEGTIKSRQLVVRFIVSFTGQ
jgi:hypothetical protein